ncbi:hypothetical protein XO10_02015 [Marinitoga sp. 1135]|uniref:SLC13 family permease n=1 Tax=Marinitoga piezophila TaxID=149715 RepID=UPI0003108855|nr:SLC13 family permease [Marinitoga piezophila]APT75345.1 hypothetical protein LN42_02295 [Marinitoga sp. 1137]NUU95074.1 hypothetical protein [Marinitoga sp. 1135]NUU97028.1 hypothetical protein [Marinitoga sp. 1138]
MIAIDRVKKYIMEEKLIVFLFVFLIIISFMYKISPVQYPELINWKTIFFLSGLLLITKSIELSNYFHHIAIFMVKKAHYERNLVYFLIIISTFLAMILTNDITLFIVIPLTIKLKKLVNFDFSRIIILEIIAVNIGSSLTPIGNPQNIFIWHNYGTGVFNFILKMMPFFLLEFFLLIVYATFLVKNKKMEIVISDEKYDNNAFFNSLIILLMYIISSNYEDFFYLFLGVIFVYYLITKKSVISKCDWNIILLFILFFINFNILSMIPEIKYFIEHFGLNNGKNLFLFSTGLSQIISNVPATIFLSNYTDNWYYLSYGVNLAGTGFIIGSLANIIGLRISKIENGMKTYHKYAIPYFLISLLLISLIIK